jgi:N-acetylneuraminic acid mutarotase
MRKSAALVLILVFLIASCIMAAKPAFSSAGIVEDSWTSKAPMPTARFALGVAVVNGKIYAIGGRDSSFDLVGNNERYDPESNTWETLAPMPTPRARFGIAVFQNKIYVIGGAVGSSPYFQNNGMGIAIMTRANQVYDPATNTWEDKTPMPIELGVMQANTVDGKIYVSGAFTEAYDPVTDSWIIMASMPISQKEFSSAVVDDKIFFISDKVQIFNPKSNQWSTGTSPPKAVFQGAAAATAGFMAPKRIYLLQGGVGFNQVYNPDNDSWTTGASMPNPNLNRLQLAVAVVNDTLYVLGGNNTNDPYALNIVALNDQYTPIGYGTILPKIIVDSPENMIYNSSSLALSFTVDKPAAWLGYSLDGQDNITVTGNSTISGLTNGLHNVTVYARDEFENTGASETNTFRVDVREPFPTVPVAAASVAVVAVVGVVLLFYFKKRKH